jgi:ketosteroid isomerase-like protein
MSPSPRDVLDQFYAAEKEYVAAGATFDGLAATLHPEVVLHQPPDLPWGGDWQGHEGFKAWSVEMTRHFDRIDVQDAEFFTSDDQVVVKCDLTIRSRATGRTVSGPMVQVVTVKDGKITDFRPFYWNVAEYVALVEEAET